MRVLLSTTAGAGHFGPMIPVATACSAAGHEVAVAAPTSFASQVQSSGLSHLPFPDVPADRLGAVFARLPELPREEADRIVLTEVFGRLDAQAALPTVIDIIAEWQPDMVIRDPSEFGSLVAARQAGIPQLQVAIGLDQMTVTIASLLDEPLRELQEIAGLPPVRGADLVLGTPTLSSVPPSLDATPGTEGDSGQQERRFWRYRNDARPTGPSLPAQWGDPTTPLVYVSFGSVAGSLGQFGGVYPAILDVLTDLPIRVLLTTGAGFDPAQLQPVPRNAWVTQWWPQDSVMTEAALVIGHGGFGTTMSALRAGVPQIVLPLFAADQFLNAERIAAVGAGVQLLGGLAALDRIPDAVTDMLQQPRFADGARAIAAEMATLPEVGECVRVLQELAGTP
jgi:UDP:flavonoid glycosyltransferase YjiC (YdhE family)